MWDEPGALFASAARRATSDRADRAAPAPVVVCCVHRAQHVTASLGHKWSLITCTAPLDKTDAGPSGSGVGAKGTWGQRVPSCSWPAPDGDNGCCHVRGTAFHLGHAPSQLLKVHFWPLSRELRHAALAPTGMHGRYHVSAGVSPWEWELSPHAHTCSLPTITCPQGPGRGQPLAVDTQPSPPPSLPRPTMAALPWARHTFPPTSRPE